MTFSPIRSSWMAGLGIVLLAGTASGCQDDPAERPSACAFIENDTLADVTGTSDWTATEDLLATDGDNTRARCRITIDGDAAAPFIQLKASSPSDPAVIEENIRQQLADPDFNDRLAEPCTEYDGDPGVGIGCDSISNGVTPDDSYVYVHSKDSSVSTVVAGWPEAAPAAERREVAESLTREFIDGFTAYRQRS